MRPETIEFTDEMPVKVFVGNVEHYPYHWHNALEIIYVLRGQVNVIMSSETYLLKENNIAVINANEPHSIRNNGGDNTLLIIQIDPAFCAGSNPGFKSCLFYCCSAYHEKEAPEKYDTLKSYIAHLVCLLGDGPRKNPPANAKNCIEEILAHLIDSFDYLKYGIGITALTDKQVQRYKRIFENIRNAPAQKLVLEELAVIYGISYQHLSRDIKEKFGRTFHELVHYVRCEQAVRLLLSTDKKIYEISPECGFSDPKYMVQSFKLFYQCTPLAFRKKHRADAGKLAAQVRYKKMPLSCAFKTKSIRNYGALLKSSASILDKKTGHTMPATI